MADQNVDTTLGIYPEDTMPSVDSENRITFFDYPETNLKFIHELDKINPSLATRLLETGFEPVQPQSRRSLARAKIYNLKEIGSDLIDLVRWEDGNTIQAARGTAITGAGLSRNTFDLAMAEEAKGVPFAGQNVTAGRATDMDPETAKWLKLAEDADAQAARDNQAQTLIEQFKQDLANQKMNAEQRGIYDVMVGNQSETEIKISDLNDLQYAILESGSRAFGAKHVLIKHYSGFAGPVSAREIIDLGTFIRNGKIDGSQSSSNRHVYQSNANDGKTLTVIIEKNKFGDRTIVSFYSNRKGWSGTHSGTTEANPSVKNTLSKPAGNVKPQFYRSSDGTIRAITYGKRSHFFLDRYDSVSELRKDILEEAGHRLVNELGAPEWVGPAGIGRQTYRGRWADIVKEIEANYGHKPGSEAFNHELVAKAFRDGQHNAGFWRRFLDAIVAAYRRMMRRLGKTLAMTDAEIRDYIRRLLKAKMARQPSNYVGRSGQARMDVEEMRGVQFAKGATPAGSAPSVARAISIRFPGEASSGGRSVPEFSTENTELQGWIQVNLGGLEHVKAIRMPEMLRMVQQLGLDYPTLRNLPSSYGLFKGNPLLGAQITLDRRIFQDPRLAAAVFAHEIGHLVDYLPEGSLKRGNLLGHIAALNGFLSNKLGSALTTNKQLRAEVWALSKWWKPIEEEMASANHLQYRKSAKELYADALSILLNSPAELKARAPLFWKEFFRHIEARPEVKAQLLELWELLSSNQDTMKVRRASRLENYTTAEDMLLKLEEARKAEHETLRGWLNGMKTDHWYEYQAAVDVGNRVKATGRKLTPAEDPEYLFDEHPLAATNASSTLMRSFWEEIIKPCEDAGLDQRNISEYIELDRILNERFEDPETGEITGRAVMANPGATTPNDARDELEYMRTWMGDENFAKVRGWANRMQDIFWDLMLEARDSGRFSRDIVAKLEPNKHHYGPFATISKLEQSEGYIPAGIMQQHGTLEAVAPPFTIFMLKALKLKRAIQYQRSKSVLIDRLLDLNEATIAPTHWKNGKWEAERAPRGKELFMRYEDGKPVWYYVEPEIVQMFEERTPADQDRIVSVMNWAFRSGIYQMWVFKSTPSSRGGERHPLTL